MYYLSKFCRICIKTGVDMLDISSYDIDQVSFGEKLEVCMKMVINSESLSTQICLQCVKKLRTSYEFHRMCKQSTKILQGYLSELISFSEKVTADNFVNSELKVTLRPLLNPHVNAAVILPPKPAPNHNHHHSNSTRKKKRITKEQRCSLLKKLLMSKKKAYKKHQKPPPRTRQDYKHKPNTAHNDNKPRIKGGLRDILNFTRNYDFGYKLDGHECSNNVLPTDQTPLQKLEDFTKSFFTHNFADFKNTILYLIEHQEDLSSDSDTDSNMFDDYVCADVEHVSEEVIVEPDIKIKEEMDYDYENEDCDFYSCNYYVETSFSDTEMKKDAEDARTNAESSSSSSNSSGSNLLSPLPGSSSKMYRQLPMRRELLNLNPEGSSSSVEMLDKLVGNLGRRPFSRHSVRCRTRGNPYINPTLREQFQLKSFQCTKCNRYFKSPGYLKAHISKVHLLL